MKKILLSLTTLLFLFTTSVYSIEISVPSTTALAIKDLMGNPTKDKIEIKETDSIRVEQIVVPENERWMVDRVLEQNPELKEGDISRVEYSFGVYYGQISRKTRVADGIGILGVRVDDTINVVPVDNEVSTYYGIETTFEDGKLGKKSEQTILTVSDGKALEAKKNIADQIKFQNQAFNNGFKLKADLEQLLSNDLQNTMASMEDDMRAIYPTLKDPGNFIDERTKELFLFDDIDYNLYKVQSTVDAILEGKNNNFEEIEYYIRNANYLLGIQISNLTKLKELLPTETEKDNPGSKKINLGDIIRDAALSSHIGRLVDLKSKTNKAYELLNQPEIKALLTVRQFNFDLMENLNTLGSTKNFLDKEKDFKEVRIVDGFNMRKNTIGTSIEAKSNNGKWYLVEYVLNDDNTFTLQLTDEGKKNYEKDKKDSSGSGEEMGGS